MLPPQLRQGIRPRCLNATYSLALSSPPRSLAVAAVVTVPTLHSQHPRTCFGWHRKYDRNDLRIQRLRHRILKAKLLQSLKSPYNSTSKALGWRLSSSWGRSRQPDEPDNEAGNGKADSRDPRDGYPYELSDREKRWQQRMDDIKKWIDQDPYDALFGWSNRMRRGEPLDDWVSRAVPRWFREQTDSLREDMTKDRGSARNEAQKEANAVPKAEKEPTQSAQEAKTESPEAQGSQTSTEQPSTAKIFIRRSIDEPPLEYDPISNRMIRKGDKAFSHYAQELDVAEAAAKAEKPPVFPRKVSVDIPEAPETSKTASEPKDSSKGSLTPYKSPNSADVRAEYEAYKEQRLKALEGIKKQIQDAKAELDAFEKEPSVFADREQQDFDQKAEYRAKLESDFEKVHSEQDITERDLPSLTPYKVQRSKGTVVQSRTDAMAAESGSDSPQLHPNFKPAHDHRKIVLTQLDDIDVQDKRLQKQITELGNRIDPSDKDIDVLEAKLESLWMKRKSLEMQRADLNRQLRDLRWSEMASMSNPNPYQLNKMERMERMVKLSGKRINHLENKLETDLSRQVMDDRLNQMGGSHPSELAGRISKPAIYPIGGQPYPEIRNTPHTTTNLETALDRFKSANVEPSKGLQTALQRHSKDSVVLADSQGHHEQTQLSELDTPTRRHEPYGYDHGRESAKVVRLGSVQPASKIDSPSTPAASKPMASKPIWPSKSETVIERLYRTDIIDKLKNLVHRITEPAEPKQLTAEELRRQEQQQAAKNMLDEEIKHQKLAMQKMEMRKRQPTSETPEPVALPDPDSIQKRAAEEVAKKEQKAQDAELVRQLRNIYEKEYGLITTKHRQVKELGQEAVQEEMLAQMNVKRTDEPLTAFSLAIAPKNTETATESSNVSTPEPLRRSTLEAVRAPSLEASTSKSEVPAETPPASEVENAASVGAPSPATEPSAPKPETTSFIILAYDHDTSSVTRATVSAPPTSTETPMPLTVALAQLTHPAKFLPHLQQLKHQGFVLVSCSNSLLILRRIGPQTAQPGAEQKKTMKPIEELVNPVDKTAAPGLAHVPTGDFASPTGFVNYNATQDMSSSAAPHHRHRNQHHKQHANAEAAPWGYKRKPRRVERVFSGGSGGGGSGNGKVHKNWRWEQRKERRRRWKRFLKGLAATFGLSVALVYVAGVVAEMRREMRKVSVLGEGRRKD